MQENWYDWAVRTKDYLHNATLSPRQFDAEKTDHVHCEICWAKFSKRPEDLHFGYTEYKGDWNMQSIETYGEDYNPRAPEAKYCQYFWLPNSEMPEEYTLMGQGSQTDFTLGLADMGYPKY